MVDAINCSDLFAWPPNVLNPNCYAITWAKLFGTAAEKAAAYGATSPDVMYPPIQPPPAVGAPAGPALTLPPADGTDAAATIDRVLARQLAAWKAANADTMTDAAGNITAASKTPGFLDGQSITTWLLIGAAVVAVLLIMEQRR